MPKKSAPNIILPLDVDSKYKKEYLKNYSTLTHDSGKLFMVAGDQRVEHLITSFYGEDIDYDDLSPEHYFKISSKANIGAFATQIGLINRYGMDYSKIPYIVKLNSISRVSKDAYGYSFSRRWADIEDVLAIKRRGKLNIVGIGYTLYVGIKDESKMLQEASYLINKAHFYGLPVVLWVYPKGKGVENETDPTIISTVASIASALGTDFIKINAPDDNRELKHLSNTVIAAGRSKIVTAGGESIDPEEYLDVVWQELNLAKVSGVAVGRNVHQKSVPEAVKFCDSVYSLVVEGKKVDTVIKKNYG